MFCQYVCTCHAAWCLWRPEEDVEGMDGYDPPCRCLEAEPGPLQKHPVLLTTPPSLQPQSSLLRFNTILL